MAKNPEHQAIGEKSVDPSSNEASTSQAHAIAAEVLEQVGGDAGKAAEALQARALHDDALFREVMLPLVPQACAAIVSSVIRTRRRSICNPVKEATDAAAGAAALQNTAQSMLDFPLPGGKLLRHASAEDCKAAAHMYERQATDMAGKSRFLRNVGLRCGANIVGEVLTEIELVQLFKRAMQS